jgi:hypothetical protein
MRMRTIAVSGYVLVLALATGVLCQVAMRAGVLIPTAIPLAMIPVAGLYFLRSDEELAGWVLFTAALGWTYLDGGAPFEFAGALGIAILAGLRANRLRVKKDPDMGFSVVGEGVLCFGGAGDRTRTCTS